MMTRATPQRILEELGTALDELRVTDVRQIIESIDPSTFDTDQAEIALRMIRRKRLFRELEQAASLFALGRTEDSPNVRRQLAQALLDQGRVDPGLAVLRALQPRAQEDPVEGPEMRGLMGRAYKQRYLEGGSQEDLRGAIDSYRDDWERSASRWHGINLVALMMRAERDGLSSGLDLDARETAADILHEVEKLTQPAVWDMAVATEAAVALDDHQRAIAWLKAFAETTSTKRNKAADAFEVGSILRQLREVWELEGTPLGAKLIPVLEYELLHREGASLNPSVETGTDEGFQGIYGQEGYTRFQWIDTLQATCRSVARVAERGSGQPFGTGFLIRGGDLNEAWGDRPVFVTNSHVLSDDPADGAPLQPGQATAEFTRVEGRPHADLGKLLFRSPRAALDTSICEIKAPAGVAPLSTTLYTPALGDPTQRIYVAGHPKGTDLTVSLYDNKLVAYQDPFVHYRSPTDPGHSGSPVLNRSLDTFALHHRAPPGLEANEGVLLQSIKDANTQ